MGRFAEGTEVSSARSRDEIERTLTRYGAESFAYGWEHGKAVVQFRAQGRFVRFVLPMPDREDPEFTHTPTRRNRRSDAQIESAYEGAVRQRWRALNLVIKAKLEAVESGITTFEEEFLAHTLLPDGSTVGEWVEPQVAQAYLDGEMPKSLLALPERATG